MIGVIDHCILGRSIRAYMWSEMERDTHYKDNGRYNTKVLVQLYVTREITRHIMHSMIANDTTSTKIMYPK